MKLLRILFTLTAAFAIGHMTFAQSATSNWCGTDQALEEYLQQNPQERLEYEEEILRFARQMPNVQMNKSNHKLIIPVVVHIVHNNGQGNISKGQIDDAIRILNEDFNRLNADTSIVRGVFSNLIADMEIEFRLAKLDPNGNCTQGVTRTNSPSASSSPSNRNAPKSVINWDPYSYFNIWVVNSIASSGGGNTLGFAQFPSSPQSASTYGIVIRADEMGSIGSASTASGRTLTHEVGHCFNLYHTFQGRCGTSCHSSGDFVCDTPPQFDDLNNSCSFSNSCSNDATGGGAANPNPYSSNVPDQTENYMGYAIGCQAMFTPVQKNRTYAAFSTYTVMSSLVDTANLTQTGTNDGYVPQVCAPNVEINDAPKYVCEGGQVTFSDDSWGGPLTNYEWTFQGGTPSTSTQVNPTVTYASTGDYDVKLKISNAGGADSISRTSFVRVGDVIGNNSAHNFLEDYENSSSFAADWRIIPSSGNPDWARVGLGSASSNSIWLNNASISNQGAINQIISPSIRFDNVSSPSMSFDVAFRRKSSSDNDQLKIKYSVDCGNSWSNVIALPASVLAYDNTYSTTQFAPTSANHWKTIPLPSNYLPTNLKNSASAYIMIEFVSGGGNNIFIDNFSFNGVIVSLDEVVKSKGNTFSIFPNPANDYVNIDLKIKEGSQQAELYISNILGKRVKNINSGALKQNDYRFNVDVSDLAAGVYFITLQTDNGTKSQKLIVR